MNSDTIGWNLEHSYTSLPNMFYERVSLNPVASPRVIVVNRTLAESLGLDADALKEGEEAVLAGNRIPEGGVPIAQAYAGHQFGHFTKLGDGRAILLGEQVAPAGGRFDIQLKGSGRTPYSRGGDGRAALGPMLREFIISEAMHGLGIPTTRSLAVTETGEAVQRETRLPGAILTRVASSHIRVGTFQYAAAAGSANDLRALADYTIDRHYPHVKKSENRYLMLLREVISKQAELIASWQLVGFIHGVMNTDNMSIACETIDYGPCAFMDEYNPATVFSSIDREGRYAYGNQPYIGGWNLARFAESLLPLLDDDEKKALEIAQEEITRYSEQYKASWLAGMRAKIGLFAEEAGDAALIDSLLGLMEKSRADYTNTFSALAYGKDPEKLAGRPEFNEWLKRWKQRLESQGKSDDEVAEMMRKHNPVMIPRNHKVEEALEAAVVTGDFSLMGRLMKELADPYTYTAGKEEYTAPPAPSDVPYRTYCGT